MTLTANTGDTRADAKAAGDVQAAAKVAAEQGVHGPAQWSLEEFPISALLSAQKSQDELPGSHAEGIETSTSRLVGRTEDATHWVTIDKEGSICLITALDTATPKGGQTCTTSERFERRGLTLWTAGRADEPSSEAHLVPDGFADAVAESTGWQRKSQNLVVSDPNAPPIPRSAATVETRAGKLTVDDFPPR
ncbi:hypothetical protein EF847_19730 [Actinobacteria bacterium YIM 96077]|uniref:Uncharacterized protein n=2 Tax=Phytoactinopolyspora halophila TaxID=1981511 RepID=A0A329QRN1_9ACTN|nr:hypothetical protein EF847_19730 [Actinobacteria bacterium YIM 96077]RAW14032.1 hypothetical protein DPM12_11405 [Phytoactinopolyspora halophila]